MSVIESLKTRLAAYPEVHWIETSHSIEVPAVDPSGFPVRLQLSDEGWSVYFDAWHEEFTSETDAIACFLTGLGPRVRLAVTYRGTTPTAWTLEGQRAGQWMADSVTALIFIPFWRRRRVEYRQNRHVPGEPTTNPDDTARPDRRPPTAPGDSST